MKNLCKLALCLMLLAGVTLVGWAAPARADGAGYTVEFTRNGLEYVLPGDTSVAMSEILSTLGLTGEVTAVEISDTSLFSASNETGVWIVTAHKAFSTTEWMKVTINGVTYEITVTDEQEAVSYLDASGATQACETYTTLAADTPTTWGSGWYVAEAGTLTIGSRVTVSGDVHLILCDNAALTVTGGINVAGNNSLTIYAQSTGSDKGALTVSGVASKNAGIGGNSSQSGGTITVNGGKITVTGGQYCAGIGGSYDSSHGGAGGTVTVNGGTVTATGGEEGAGIGGGKYGEGGNITISGGTVNATGGIEGAGIGGGHGLVGGTITVSGGTVTATGGDYGAGIGGGLRGAGGNIAISGGTVTANGGKFAAGIGGGDEGAGGTIIVTGGNITANGSSNYGTGIGASSRYSGREPGTLTVGFDNASDSLKATSYSGAVSVAANKVLADGSAYYAGELSGDEKSTISNKTLQKNDTAYIVHRSVTGSGAIAVSPSAALPDTEITFTLSPTAGSVLLESGVTYTDGSATITPTQDANDPTKYTFTMPAAHVTVSAVFGHTVTVSDSIIGGSVSANKGSAADGTTVNLTVSPDSGYVIGAVRYIDGTDHVIEPVNGEYSFTMPDADVTVSATFLRDIETDMAVLLGGILNGAGFPHTGDPVEPAVTVVDYLDNNKSLTQGTDFTVSYSNNVNLTTDNSLATATITGIGAYTGTVTEEFRITPYNIGACELKGTLEAYNDGYGPYNPLSENVQVLNNGTPLTLYTDYELEIEEADSWVVNTTYHAVIIGSGDWGGSIPFDFTLVALHHTVVFVANGGSGEMESVTVANNGGYAGIYYLPECGFTAPEGQIFDHWVVDYKDIEEDPVKQPGQYFTAPYIYQPSDVQTITVTAYYRDKASVTLTASNLEHASLLVNGAAAELTEGVAQVTEDDVITVIPASGYGVDSAAYAPTAGGDATPITADPDTGAYTFRMPSFDATVTASVSLNEWGQLQALLQTGGSYKLGEGTLAAYGDIAAQAHDTALEVPAGVTVTLDLNGHTIDRHLAGSEEKYDSVIIVKGNLTVTDTGAGGKITGGNARKSGGGVFVDDGAFTLSGGIITGNEAGVGGGVGNYGTMTLDGGTISGNTAKESGGGVFNNGTLTLNSGALISGNTAHQYGGGVENLGTMIMNGGEISGNTANRYGGGIIMDGTMNLSGSPVVTGNVRGGTITNGTLSGGTPDNLLIMDKTITVTGALTSAASVGVGLGEYNENTYTYDQVPGVFTSGLSGKGTAASFTSDSAAYAVGINAAGEGCLNTPVTVSFSAGEGGGSMASVTVAKDCEYTLPSCGFTAPAGKVFKEWSVKIGESEAEAKAPGESFTVTDADVTVQAAFARVSVTYRKADGETETLSSGQFTLLTANTETLSGWVVADGDIDMGATRLSVSGAANLILVDGATLAVPKGIHVTGGDSLTFYGQSAGTGKLIIDDVDYGNAGIGGNEGENGGTVTVHGGDIKVAGGEEAAGIGGSYDSAGGHITVTRGTVTATGGDYAAGIGGGNRGSGGEITVSGGEIEATGGEGAAGIGGGCWGSGGEITVSGGIVTANGGAWAAGIGGGSNGNGGNITVTGGDIVATGGTGALDDGGSVGGAGIGGGTNGDGGTVVITGGVLTATGGGAGQYGGAGIGGGNASLNLGRGGHGANVTIEGGSVTASGKGVAAGIGGAGAHWNSGALTIQLAAGAALRANRYGGAVNVLGGVKDEATGACFLGELSTQAISDLGGRKLVRAENVHAVTLTVVGNGAVAGCPVAAQAGDKITLTPTPDAGYALESLTVNGEALSESPYTFTMPDADVTVAAAFGGETVAYIDENGEAQSARYRSFTDQTTALQTGWYAVAGSIANDDTRLEVSGDARLILCDGAALTLPRGIHVGPGNRLTIYAQSAGTGRLTAEGDANTDAAGSAAIGGDGGEDGGVITINGGDIRVKPGYNGGAALGGGYNGDGGVVTVNGGTVTASGNRDHDNERSTTGIGGSGIGGAGRVTINGGTVQTTGDCIAIGVGTGVIGWGGEITINGGTVTTHNGIGGGSTEGTPLYITVNGGTVNASNDYAAGIGEIIENGGNGGYITVTGGTVNATGEVGIGGGFEGAGHGRLTVSGGVVTATGTNGAGIGAENGRNCATDVTVSGGEVTATSQRGGAGIGGGSGNYSNGMNGAGGIVTISGGKVTATGADGGAGIGGGYDGPGGTVTITGGQITATGGTGGGTGIGCGNDHNDNIWNTDYVYTPGTLSVGFDSDDDSLTASGYTGTVTVEEGKYLKDSASGQCYSGTLNNDDIAGKTLVKAGPPHDITVCFAGHGEVTASATQADAGTTVALTVEPEDGYALGALTVTSYDEYYEQVETVATAPGTGENAGKTVFAMPDYDVEVEATFLPLWQALQARFNNASEDKDDPTVITLEQDVTAEESDTYLTVPSGKYVTLDLNGHTIDRKLSSATANGNVITVYGNLTVMDSVGGGSITGGKSTSSGGGMVIDGGAATLSGGTITDNTASPHGGGVFIKSGSLTLNGGSVSGNTASNDGGGVYINNGGTMTLSSGVVSGNTANDGQGGGVYIYDGGTLTITGGSVSGNSSRNHGGGIDMYDGTLNLSGGTISGNTTGRYGGGIYFQHGRLNLSGSPTVTGNVRGGTITNGTLSGGTADNLFVYNSQPVTVADTLGSAASVGVGVWEYSDSTYTQVPGVFTSGLSGKGTAASFTSDSDAYAVRLDESNEAKLVPAHSVTFAAGYENPTGEMAPVTVETGASYTLPSCGFTAPAGKTFKEWSVVIGTAVAVTKAPDETITVSADTTVTAVWEKEADFVLPAFLTLIEESAFEGIAAESVEVTGNVAAIETRAFADCKSLREITIPATVLKIDDHAFDGCEGVTVYGRSGTEAERIANLYGFTFVDPNAEPETPATPVTPEQPPVVLPFLPAD